MNPSSARRLPRQLYARLGASRAAREERSFASSIRLDAEAPALLLSPHWDDAVLDCWEQLSGEEPLLVVNVFAGVPDAHIATPWDGITGASDAVARSRERMAEDAATLGRVGREPANLPFLDAQYRRGGGPPPLSQLDGAVAAAAASVSHVYAPAAIGGHPDHRHTRRYALALARSGLPVSLYADLPYCILHGWPHWVDGRVPDPHRNPDAFWEPFLDGVDGLGPLRDGKVTRLDDAAAAAKLAAMRAYLTQYPALDYGGRGLLADPEIHRYEVRWPIARAG
jgi:LmbE family N-acetylglucosaminyl deacetylase